MNGQTPRLLGVALVLMAITVLSDLPSMARSADVTLGDSDVVVEGDVVRLGGAGGVTAARGDWRGGGSVQVGGDTDGILAELGGVSVGDRIQLTLGEGILFDFDSSAIRSNAAESLGKLAQVIRTRSVGDVYIMGHTDSIGGSTYNKKLSRQRAVAVMDWLNRNEGIPAGVMAGVGMGASRPVARESRADGSDDEVGRARNRRVEVQMATREGVQVGPDVVIGRNGVQIGSSGIDVGKGSVKVDSSGVRVGDVKVGVGGIRVGGITVGDADRGSTNALIVTDGAPSFCGEGENCALACPGGNCSMTCEAGGVCDFSCVGGDCLMGCDSGASCDFSCAGGFCGMKCASDAGCDFRCPGGDCKFQCPGGANCRSVSCSGEECVCKGAAC